MAAIELSLAPGKAPVDLAVRLIEPEQARRLAAQLQCSPDFLRDFLWAREPDTAQLAAPMRPTHSIWLEFDLDSDPVSPLPDPVVCARLQHSAELTWVEDDLLSQLHGIPLSTLQSRLFCTAWEAIPEDCVPLYVFSLRARGTQAIRLETYGEDLEATLAWPRLARHPHASQTLPWIRSQVPALEAADRFHVSLDMDPRGWIPRIGLEASFRRQPHREPRWAGLLEDLVEGGLCDPHKRRVLEAWIGQMRLETGKLVRALGHVKLSFPGDGEADAKAYLMLQHLPVNGSKVACDAVVGIVAEQPPR